MFLGRDSCALALPATRPTVQENSLTLLFLLDSVHSRATTFRVNTYEKSRGWGGWGIPGSASRLSAGSCRLALRFSRITSHQSRVTLAARHSCSAACTAYNNPYTHVFALCAVLSSDCGSYTKNTGGGYPQLPSQFLSTPGCRLLAGGCRLLLRLSRAAAAIPRRRTG